jgi:membrane-bound metal-dependent hydrolase YbcI (DUF457 family)
MNALFHAGAGIAIGGLALGSGATPGELAVCAVAGTAPDWDAVLLAVHKPRYREYHRTITHGFIGLIAGGLIAAAVLSLFGWGFWDAAFLWLIASLGHTVSDLFNRSGVALFSPIHWKRIRFPAVSWADGPLTAGAVALAAWVILLPATGRMASLAGLAGYAAYLMHRMRDPRLSDSVSRWWFGKLHGPPDGSGGTAGPVLHKPAEDQGTDG